MRKFVPVEKGKWCLCWRGSQLDPCDWQWEAFNTREEAIEYYNYWVGQGSATYWLAEVKDQWPGDIGSFDLIGSGERDAD